MAFTLRLVRIPSNLLSSSSSEQLNTSQKAATFWLTIFVNIRLVAGRSQDWAGRPQAIERRPMLIHTRQAVPMPCCAVALRSRFQNGMVGARHGRCIACVN